MTIKLRSSAAADTQAIASEVSNLVVAGDLILATGDLGAGKTTFTQGFGAALGVTEVITSPTFVLMCNYQGRLPLHHVDVYRLDQLQEVVELGLVELLDEGGVAIVEWGEAATPVLPAEYLSISLLHSDDDDAREIEINFVGHSWEDRRNKLEDALQKWKVSE